MSLLLRPGSNAVLDMSRIESKWDQPFVRPHWASLAFDSAGMWSAPFDPGLMLEFASSVRVIRHEHYWQILTLGRCQTDGDTNGCILLTIGSIYAKLGDFMKLGLHFMTMWINSLISGNEENALWINCRSNVTPHSATELAEFNVVCRTKSNLPQPNWFKRCSSAVLKGWSARRLERA